MRRRLHSKVSVMLILEICIGLCITFGSILLLLKLREEMLENELSYIDNQIILFLYSIRTPSLNMLMRVITPFGEQMIIISGVIIWLLLIIKRHIRTSILFVCMSCMSFFITIGLKQLIQRPRPFFHPLVSEGGYSFPSGHAMNSFVYYMTLTYLVYKFTKNKRLTLIAGILSAVLIALVGLSRVYLGVHYPSDVIAGYIAGLCWFASVVVMEKTMEAYRLFKHKTTS